MSLLLALHPVLGIAVGALAAGVAAVTARLAPALAAPAGALALEAASLAGSRRGLAALPGAGRLLAWVSLGLKVAAATAIPRPALASALVLAAMLGRWAVVVLCYGGAPIVRGAADELPGRAGFGEFGWASLIAFAVTLSLAEAVGLVLLLVAALVTLAVRVASHRRAGGVTGRVVRATGEVVETAVLVTLALLAVALGR